MSIKAQNAEYQQRFDERIDELKWLYCEIYHNDMQGFEWLCNSMADYYEKRDDSLKKLDRVREKDKNWYKSNKLLGMMLYTGPFAKTLRGVREKLDYLESCGVNYVHLMPLLESPKGRSDGGYAVSDFRKVQPELGTIEDLEALTKEMHERGMSCCMDFVMNHTSEEHAWAKAARAGDPEAKRRYYFYDNWDIPGQFERTMPQVFPTTAPGNFTWLDDCHQAVMTTFYPYQWDLNYENCVVFNDMAGNMLFLANCGIDVIRLDAVPYIWKTLGTNCRNLPQVHTLVRMMRLIGEIVCPGILLLGEVVMEPAKVVPYFGSVEKPECHTLYNVTTMASTWHTVATKDVALLKRQLEQVFALPKEYVFLNYLRCHDDIGWGLDYDWLKNFEIKEVDHKKYLNDYLTGKWAGSDARGELYNDDPRLGDARLCGTTASLSGLEAALYERDEAKAEKAVKRIEMLHAYLLSLSGLPVLYSGDEIGQCNDYTYKNDPDKQADSRYLHRGSFPWEIVKEKVPQKIFKALRKLETCRAEHDIFTMEAKTVVFETGSIHVLGICRTLDEKKFVAYYNFSDEPLEIDDSILGDKKGFVNLASGKKIAGDVKTIEGCGYLWLYRER